MVGFSGDTVQSLRALRERKGWSLDLFHADVEALRAFGVLKKESGWHGTPVAVPAALVADAAGIVRFIEARDALFARVGPKTLLTALDRLANSQLPTPNS